MSNIKIAGDDRPPLLFLVHRIPYPPNKGDKIRSFHWLSALAQRYRVFLATFVDHEADWQYVDELKRYCHEVYVAGLSRRRSLLRASLTFLTGESITRLYYRHENMAAWVKRVVEQNQIKDVLVFSSSMAQYVDGPHYKHLNRVIDFVDVDSDKWQQYAEFKPWPLSWLYIREAKRLLSYERYISESFRKVFFVSREEAKLFSTKMAGQHHWIEYVNNGVVPLSAATIEVDNPFEGGSAKRNIVFTGTLDYWPNEDAVLWFVDKVYSRLAEVDVDIRFYVVGSNPSRKIAALERISGVRVVANVADIKPYLIHADVAVAPLRIARGVQNKVLEAIAAGVPCVASRRAMEGINVDCNYLYEAGDEKSWYQLLRQILHQSPTGRRESQRVCRGMEQYDWELSAVKLLEIIAREDKA